MFTPQNATEEPLLEEPMELQEMPEVQVRLTGDHFPFLAFCCLNFQENLTLIKLTTKLIHLPKIVA